MNISLSLESRLMIPDSKLAGIENLDKSKDQGLSFWSRMFAIYEDQIYMAQM